jgi:hypothetical protein
MGFGPLGPTSPPGLVEPDRLGSGSVNRPSPAPSHSPSLPRELRRTLNCHRRCPTIPANSGGLRHRCPTISANSGGLRHRRLGQNCRPNSLYHLLQLESTGASSPGRSVGGFLLVFAVAGRLRLDASPSPLQVLAVQPLALVMCEYTPVEASWCGAPGVLGEVFLGQPLAGRAGTALPWRPDKHLGNGERDFSSSLLFFFFSGHGLWPTGPGQWAKLTDFVLWCY